MVLLLSAIFIIYTYCFWNKEHNLFDSITNTIIVITFLVILITNLFSFFNLLIPILIKLFWLTVFVIALIWIIWTKQFPKRNTLVPYFKQLKSFPFYIFIGLTVISFLYARFTIPNNWDSMTYHLARVAHWINNKSVNYYYTNNLRQLLSPVLDEYFLLHIILLSGNDNYVNLLQWFSYIISALYIYKTIRLLDCSASFAFAGSILFMTMPIAFAESMTTQNDLFATMYLWLFIYKAVNIAKNNNIYFSNKNLTDITSLGILIGFGYLAKTSVCVPMFYFLICLIIYFFYAKKITIRDFCIYSIISAVCCAIIVSETFIRWKYYGSIDTSVVTNSIVVATKNPIMLLFNLYKNISNLIVFSPTISFLLKLIGVKSTGIFGININSQEINFNNIEFYPSFSFHHDFASAYIVTIAGFIAFFYFIVKKNIKKQKRIFASIIFIGFLTIPLILRWQPWGSRIMLPCVSLLSVLIILLLDDICFQYEIRQVLLTCVYLVCLMSYYPQLESHLLPVYTYLNSGNDRFYMYFYNRQEIYTDYKKLIEYCEKLDSKNIALCTGGDSYVYPFLHFFKTKYDVNVSEFPIRETELAKILCITSFPDYIACIEIYNGDTFTINGCSYEEIFSTGGPANYRVYKKQSNEIKY